MTVNHSILEVHPQTRMINTQEEANETNLDKKVEKTMRIICFSSMRDTTLSARFLIRREVFSWNENTYAPQCSLGQHHSRFMTSLYDPRLGFNYILAISPTWSCNRLIIRNVQFDCISTDEQENPIAIKRHIPFRSHSHIS